MIYKSSKLSYGQPSAGLLFTIDAYGKQVHFEDHTKILDYTGSKYTWNANIFVVYLGEQCKLRRAEEEGCLSSFITNLVEPWDETVEDLTLDSSMGPKLDRIFRLGYSYLPQENRTFEPVIHLPWAKGGVSESRISVKVFFGINLYRFRRYVLAIIATYRMAKMCGMMGPSVGAMPDAIYSKLNTLSISSRYDFMAPLHLTSMTTDERNAAVGDAMNWVNTVLKSVDNPLHLENDFYITHFRPLFADYYRSVIGPMLAYKHKTVHSAISVEKGLTWVKKLDGGYDGSYYALDHLPLHVKFTQWQKLQMSDRDAEWSNDDLICIHSRVSRRVFTTDGITVNPMTDGLPSMSYIEYDAALATGISNILTRPTWGLVYETLPDLDSRNFANVWMMMNSPHTFNYDWPDEGQDKPLYTDYIIQWGEQQDKQKRLLKQCLKELVNLTKIYNPHRDERINALVCMAQNLYNKAKYKRYWNIFRGSIPAMTGPDRRILRDVHDNIIPSYDAFDVPTLSWPLEYI